jgi:hypothetical protein
VIEPAAATLDESREGTTQPDSGQPEGDRAAILAHLLMEYLLLTKSASTVKLTK